MLGGNHYRIYTHGPIPFVLHRGLRLPIGSQIGENPLFTHLRQPLHQIMRQHNRHRHQLLRLPAREAKHHPLIPRALLLVQPVAFRHALRNIRRLLVYAGQHRARGTIESILRPGISDLLDRTPHQLRNIHVARRGDLSGHQRHPGGDQRLTRHPAIRVLSQHRIQDRIRNLIRHLVRMALGHRLRSEHTPLCHVNPLLGDW